MCHRWNQLKKVRHSVRTEAVGLGIVGIPEGVLGGGSVLATVVDDLMLWLVWVAEEPHDATTAARARASHMTPMRSIRTR